MLSSLYIENIAVIERASIDFDKGYTVLTGETGAGKSIIIDAINAVLGERTSRDLIRTGAEKANVTALFSFINEKTKEKLAELNIPYENEELLITRDIRQNRSTAKINGVPVNAGMLKEVGANLISIHGQHDSYELMDEEIHGRYIDSFGGLNSLLKSYQQEYNHLRAIKRELDKLLMDENQKSRRLDLLKYQVEEIEKASVKIGERDALISRRDTIRNGEAIMNALNFVKNALSGDGETEGAENLTAMAADTMETAAKNLPALEKISEKLNDLRYEIEDVAEEVRDLAESFDFDPNELEEIENRLDLLYRLSLKYGETEEDILKYYEECINELRSIELSDEKIEELSAEFEVVKKKAVDLARELSHKRKDAGALFASRVKEELSFLNMPGVEFAVKQERVSLNINGCDKIEFLVSANRGEELKSMSKIASGGELSRIMLSIKTVLSGGDEIDTLIFDEIDTGISGEAANKVGLKLKEAAGDRQVLCITHLAQIAAMAKNQLLIKKETEGEKTFTKVRKLSRDERKTELARMIGGDGITELKLQMADEMLQSSEN